MRGRTTVVIGGGAAGMMAAGRAAERGARVMLFEKMAQPGRKIGISGKGRCNLTNSAGLNDFMDQFGRNGRFLRQAFQHFFSKELVAFFENHDLPLVKERGGRFFPAGGRALDVVRVLARWLDETGVAVHRNSPVSALVIDNKEIRGVISGDRVFHCTSVILATGGRSYPRTGSTGDGYLLAEQAGHSIVPPRPALVPLLAGGREMRLLDGLNLKNVQVRIYVNGQRKGMEFGEMSFLSSGIGGPAILTLSGQIVDAFEQGKKVFAGIDLKPALSEEKLHARLIRDFSIRGKEPMGSVLRGLLPKELVSFCMQACDIPAELEAGQAPAKMRKRLVHWLKDFRVEVTGHGTWDEAIVTAGGVNLREIDPQTMESKLVGGLFIAGELLDLNGNTGGYNLQAAFSTGWVAGESVPV